MAQLTPPNVRQQLVGMTARYLAVALAGALVSRHVIPVQSAGPLVDVFSAVFVFGIVWVWGWILKEGQRSHWLAALHTMPPRRDPGPPPNQGSGGTPPPPSRVEVTLRVTDPAAVEAIRAAATPPLGGGL